MLFDKQITGTNTTTAWPMCRSANQACDQLKATKLLLLNSVHELVSGVHTYDGNTNENVGGRTTLYMDKII